MKTFQQTFAELWEITSFNCGRRWNSFSALSFNSW